MKKLLKIILSLSAVLVFIYFAYTHYQKKAVLKNVIHTDAESFVKIGLHDLQKTLFFDALVSPRYYWKNAKISKDKKEKDSLDAMDKGINLMPYSLVLYTVKNVKNTLFTTFKIDDPALFEIFSKQYFKELNTSINNANYQHATNEKAKLIFAWNDKHLVVALSPKGSFEACKEVFDEILLQNKVIKDDDQAIIKQLSATNDHITFIHGDSKVTLNFNDGQAILEGLLYTDAPKTFANQISYNTIPDASFQLYFDANFAQEKNREWVISALEDISFFDKNNLDITTLVAKSKGNLSISIKGTTQQTDTIITYEYDDNFEKVETKATQEKRVPVICIDMGAEAGLNTYLKEQGALEKGILKAIPYYTFYADKDSANTAFSTLKGEQLSQKKTGSYLFNLETNFAALQKDLQIPKADKLVELLRSLRITAQQTIGNKVVVKGRIEATQSNINIISQLFFGMQEKDSI